LTNKFAIQPILGSSLPEVARFLRKWRADRDRETAVERVAPEEFASTERRLRWLLLENPHADKVAEHGFCIRDDSGTIRGLDVSFPNGFVAGDRKLLGLCSGAFFVEPEVRSQGFFLFKKHLNSRGFAFFYATSCNANSGPVWKSLGASPVEYSNREYVFPLKLDTLLPAVLADRTSNRVVARSAAVAGRCANPIMQMLARQTSRLTVEPCRDWHKLAHLSCVHRAPGLLTTERSPRYLEWRYGENSPNQPVEIYVFRDSKGNEGWFSLGHVVRGRHGQIQGHILLDAVWPRENIDFRSIFAAALPLVAAQTDALFLQPRRGVDYRACSPWIIARPGPTRIFALAAKNSDPPLSALDLVPADGDSAFRISVWAGQFK
jgi:hypothetical protein